MLDSNTNKVTWIGVAIGVVALLGVGASQLYPEAFETAKSHIVKVTGNFASSEGTGKSTSDKVAEKLRLADVPNVTDDYKNSKFKYWFYDDSKTAKLAGVASGATIDKDLVIPSKVVKNGVEYSVTQIGYDAFKRQSLDSVAIPSSVKTIDSDAFLRSGLKSISLSEGLETIGGSAFYGLNVETVVIPNSVKTIKFGAFAQNKSLRHVDFGNGVTTIEGQAFYWGDNLDDVVIPDSVTSIGDAAFSRNHITRLVIPDSVKSIAGSAFQYNSIEYLQLGNGLSEIQYQSFAGNKIKSVKIPDSVTKIGSWAFDNNNTMTSLTLGKNVTDIDKYAFSGHNIGTLEIPKSVKTIGTGAFRGMGTRQGMSGSGLKSVKFNEGLESIGDSAFYENRLSEVDLPTSVKSVGRGAFDYQFDNYVWTEDDYDYSKVLKKVIIGKNTTFVDNPDNSFDSSFQLAPGGQIIRK